MWVKLRFLGGAGPRGPRGGGAASRADGAHLGKVPLPALLARELRPHPAAPPRLPEAQQPGPGARSRPSRQRPWRIRLPHPPPPPRALRAVGAVHGERIMAIEGKWRPSEEWSPSGWRAQGLGGRPRRRLWVRADTGHRPRRGVRSRRALA